MVDTYIFEMIMASNQRYPNIPPSPCPSFLPCFCIKAKEFDVYVFSVAAVHPPAAAALT